MSEDNAYEAFEFKEHFISEQTFGELVLFHSHAHAALINMVSIIAKYDPHSYACSFNIELITSLFGLLNEFKDLSKKLEDGFDDLSEEITKLIGGDVEEDDIWNYGRNK